MSEEGTGINPCWSGGCYGQITVLFRMQETNTAVKPSRTPWIPWPLRTLCGRVLTLALAQCRCLLACGLRTRLHPHSHSLPHIRMQLVREHPLLILPWHCHPIYWDTCLHFAAAAATGAVAGSERSGAESRSQKKSRTVSRVRLLCASVCANFVTSCLQELPNLPPPPSQCPATQSQSQSQSQSRNPSPSPTRVWKAFANFHCDCSGMRASTHISIYMYIYVYGSRLEWHIY